MATSLPAFWSLSSMTSLRAFLFSRLKVRPVALGRVEGPDCGLAGASSWGQTGQSVCLLPLCSSHAALTVYICFIVHRFVNIIA